MNYDKKYKAKCRYLLHHAVKHGLVERADNCQICSSDKRLIGHHYDYSKPICAIWLCAVCHGIIHALKSKSSLENQIVYVREFRLLIKGKDKDRQKTLYLSDKAWDLAKKCAKEKGISVSKWIENAIIIQARKQGIKNVVPVSEKLRSKKER